MTDNYMMINGERFPVINAWVEVESPSDGRRRWGIVTDPAPEAEVQPAVPAGATARHPLMGVPLPDGIPEDVHLSVTTPAGPVLQLTLIAAALVARTSGGGLLPFVYRDPYDPELPDAQRPLRRATLAIIDDRIADVQPATSEAALLDRMFGPGTAEQLQKRVDGPGCTPGTVESVGGPFRGSLAGAMSMCGEPLGGNAICAMPPGHEGEHGMSGPITEAEAMAAAREVWPEAEGFLPNTRGWTFRVGAGYASVTSTGTVARDPQGTRYDAVTFMGRRTPPAAAADGPGSTPVRPYVDQDQDDEPPSRCRSGHLRDEECPECS